MNKILLLVVMILLPIAVNNSLKKDSKKIDVKYNQDNLKIDLEEYIIGVVAGEMPASFEIEALKAQAVASRTYAVNHMKNHSTISSTVDDQVYISVDDMKEKWGSEFKLYYNRIKKSVNDTKDEVITYNEEIIKSYYYSSTNGYTESSINVFNEKNDYLNVVESPEEIKEEKVILSTSDFCNKLSTACQTIEIENIEKDKSNRVSKITINGIDYTGVEIRKLLTLKSTDFTININNNIVEIITRGYGHGVGMSQYGANTLAKKGYNYKNILKYYYQNTEITKL